MRTKRKVWSKVLVGFWVILFVVGISEVFLFLQGYNPFSFAKTDIQKGYATFSSSHSLFLDSEYLGSGGLYDRYPLGVYTLCAKDLGYTSACFSPVEILGNDYSSQKIEDIVLFANGFEESVIVWTEEPVYFSEEKDGLFWYDPAKKQIFWIQEGKDSIQSFFPSFDVASVRFDEESSSYFLQGIDSLGGDIEKEVSFFSDTSSFFSQLIEQSYTFQSYRILKPLDFWSISGEVSQDLIAIFSEELERSFTLHSGVKGLVFETSVYAFQNDIERFHHLASKDLLSGVVFLKESGLLFFMDGGQLKSVKLF